MLFSINAWIDRISPFISLQNVETREEIARFDGETLENHLEQGDICMGDFCNPTAREQQVLIMDLLLLRCCDVIKEEFIEPNPAKLGRRHDKLLPDH